MVERNYCGFANVPKLGNMNFCKNALVKRNPQMQFVKSCRQTVESIRLVVSKLFAVLRLSFRSCTTLWIEDVLPARDWPWLRMHVLRRDRYRCCRCHREGDEITLHVDSTGSLSLKAHGLITLCASCHRSAQDAKLAGNRIFTLIAG